MLDAGAELGGVGASANCPMTMPCLVQRLLEVEALESYMQCNYTVGHLVFEWDEDKAAGNVIKHLVTFEEAATVFRDPMGRLIADPDHSAVEDRFLLLGHSANGHLLVVAHAYRGPDESIRLISARRAVPRERSTYGN